MEHFTEATHNQLERFVRILDNGKTGMHIDFGFLETWINGEDNGSKWSTETVIRYWEKELGLLCLLTLKDRPPKSR